MSITETTPLRVVLHEGEGSQTLESERRYEIFESLLSKGFAVTRGGSAGTVAPADDADLLVLRESEAGTSEELEGEGGVKVRVQDIGGRDVEGVAALVEEARADAGGCGMSWGPGGRHRRKYSFPERGATLSFAARLSCRLFSFLGSATCSSSSRMAVHLFLTMTLGGGIVLTGTTVPNLLSL